MDSISTIMVRQAQVCDETKMKCPVPIIEEEVPLFLDEEEDEDEVR